MLKTLLLLFAWLYGFLFVAILLAQFCAWLFSLRTPEPEDEETEKWRRAFEGTEYEWEPKVKR